MTVYNEKLEFCLRHKHNFLEFTARLAMNMEHLVMRMIW